MRRNVLGYRSDSRHYRILREISAGDLFVGFLSSSMSTRLMYRVAHKRAQDRYKNKSTLNDLETRGYVRQSIRNGYLTFLITKEGEGALQNLDMRAAQSIPHSGEWDGLWRIISYDFPERKRAQRNSLRYILKKSGFLKIQKSIWIFPYDSISLQTFLEDNSAIYRYIIFITSTNISLGEQYKKHFKL